MSASSHPSLTRDPNPAPHSPTTTADQRLVEALVTAMAAGVSPWRRPWDSFDGGHHVNLISGRRYRGANPILLTLGLQQRASSLPYWCGYGEARRQGLVPRRGSKAVVVLRPQVHRRRSMECEHPTDADTGTCWVTYRPLPIFNAADLVGDALPRLLDRRRQIDQQERRSEPVRLAAAEALLGSWPVPVSHGGDQALYRPQTDQILLPPRCAFVSAPAYYATWAHEAIHSSGHSSRLNRDLNGRLDGSEEQRRAYAREELVAELGAALLGDRLEIGAEVTHHAAYLEHWIQLLQESPAVLYRVLSDARRAADQIAPEVIHTSHPDAADPDEEDLGSLHPAAG